MEASYCQSRFRSIRWTTREVIVGGVGVGGSNPVRIQSMTNTSTTDVEASVRQVLALAEAGCDIVRLTAQNVRAAEALEAIHKQVRAAKCSVPLVADIHFLPQAAMEAAKHVEKVRINPGNYADKKKFEIREYTDDQYNAELERIHERVTPLILRCKELGRALRIGTNHGSLSDRIMNRYGDTPLGMVESALEFIRIAESHSFHNIILSMKASNPKVMIEAYRLTVQKMKEAGMNYPLHLGVTEAGDGEDGRIKSAIGIGSLLSDGLGDTIRVSLTEDPAYEVPIAQDLARRAEKLWSTTPCEGADSIDPFSYTRRETVELSLSEDCKVGSEQFPRVIIKPQIPLSRYKEIINSVLSTHKQLKENRIEGLHVVVHTLEDFQCLQELENILSPSIPSLFVEMDETMWSTTLGASDWHPKCKLILINKVVDHTSTALEVTLEWAQKHGHIVAVDTTPSVLKDCAAILKKYSETELILTHSERVPGLHPVGSYRLLAETSKEIGLKAPLWIRNAPAFALTNDDYFTAHLLDASILSGSLFCDGLGDLISIEAEPDITRATTLAYNILQGSRMRMSKTEFVACPSCGRTLFNLETTTQRIREKTGHLKGVTIAVMGCIVNGPGEMADADFGYVGGAPGKVNLYVRKDCVEYGIPEERAVDALIELIKKHERWVDPETSKTLSPSTT